MARPAEDQRELAKMAKEFAQEASSCGHEMSTLDVLDVLASCGLALVRES